MKPIAEIIAILNEESDWEQQALRLKDLRELELNNELEDDEL